MNLFDLLYHCNNVLTPEECDLFIKEYEKQKVRSVIESSNHAFDDKHYKSSFRSVELLPTNDMYSLVISKMEIALQFWVNYLEQYNSFYTKALKAKLNYPHKVRILKYEKGQSTHPHSDFADYTHATVVLNLNQDYEGGDFCFFNQKYKVKLKQGDAIIFPADYFWVHEVTPVTKNARYSINSFIKSIPYSTFTEVKDYLSNKPVIPKSFNLK